jgi:two-component system OmpR family sensor kinase
MGLGILLAGGLSAWLMRLFLPASLLQFDYAADPAATMLVFAFLTALVLLLAAAALRWQERRAARLLAQQQAEQERERQRFIQRLDHELKNPLTAIQVQLDNLQAIASDNAGAIAEVRAQADRLAQLTRGLRRLADLQTRPLEMERIEIGELLDEVVELLQAPERIRLEVQRVPWPIPPFRGDRELLLMVFRNLVDNALKYSLGGAPVQVNARDSAGALLVEVIDTGRGIPAADLPHVTSELYRGANTHDIAGSGLGLSIAERIVARHGGGLDLRSKPGQGTIVTVQLPYDPEAPR